jgi:hypothetical protein
MMVPEGPLRVFVALEPVDLTDNPLARDLDHGAVMFPPRSMSSVKSEKLATALSTWRAVSGGKLAIPCRHPPDPAMGVAAQVVVEFPDLGPALLLLLLGKLELCFGHGYVIVVRHDGTPLFSVVDVKVKERPALRGPGGLDREGRRLWGLAWC